LLCEVGFEFRKGGKINMKKKNIMITVLAIAAVVLVVVGLSLRRGRKEEPLTEKALSGIQEEHILDKTASLPDSKGKELASAPVISPDPVISSEMQGEIVDDVMQLARRKEAEKIAAVLTDCYDSWRKMKTLEMDIEMDQGMGMSDIPSPPEIHLCLENAFEATSEGEKYSHKTGVEFRHPKEGVFDFFVWIDDEGWEWRRDRQGNLVGDIKPDKRRKDQLQGLVFPIVSLFRGFISDSREDTISRIMGNNRESIGNLRGNVSMDFGDGEKVSCTLLTYGICELTIDQHKRLRRFSNSRTGVEWLFNKYTNGDGLWYPQKITLIHKGRGEEMERKLILKLSNISINTGIPPEKYALPKLYN
jgi:hypothetical protein